MKKLAAILLICLLLFNWFGFRFVTGYLEQKADRQLEARIDLNQYSDDQLIEIKVPLDMPYQNDQANFERHYGEINLKGTIYTYVKRKVENGFLILKCIPNTTKQELKTADNILFNANNGLDQEHNGNKNNTPLNNITKNSFSDFDDYSFNFKVDAFSAFQRHLMPSAVGLPNSINLPVAEQPPEVSSTSLS